jgi:hypothetical protein
MSTYTSKGPSLLKMAAMQTIKYLRKTNPVNTYQSTKKSNRENKVTYQIQCCQPLVSLYAHGTFS